MTAYVDNMALHCILSFQLCLPNLPNYKDHPKTNSNNDRKRDPVFASSAKIRVHRDQIPFGYSRETVGAAGGKMLSYGMGHSTFKPYLKLN